MRHKPLIQKIVVLGFLYMAASTVAASANQAVTSPPVPAPGPTPQDLWFGSLETLPNGGWQYLLESGTGSNTLALYVSSHDISIHGSVVVTWFRWEYMTAQQYGYQSYKSAAVREEIECNRDATRDLAVTFYSKNNLKGQSTSQVSDPHAVQWSPAVPGTIGEAMVGWGCEQIRNHHHHHH